ncbi:MAG: hypothetical protein JGK38_06930 [Microcoleus sp. PH2017_15_JOR_U_A]|jgi:hypothetical protein|uniref:hypothetical protein n=1 Tax=Microcoleus sp. PH2017_15_JOR_U_A TaxID=2798826 RepID=UPI001D54E383|nr:hypothetical protein [Microcoleus sp. PH2017_15_JOR_U_A]MCC3496383.1 hypothetical protein [Microcoleus sp. PH2017_15_JOR_U_A]
MSNQNHEELDMNELSELTPFGLDVYKTRGNFPSSKITNNGRRWSVLQSAKPLPPWNSQGDNTLKSEEASGSES